MNKSLIPIILIILAVGLYLTVTKDVLSQAKIVQSSNTEYAKAIENATNLIRLRDQVLLDYNSISVDDRAKLDKIIPTSVDNIRLIIDLNNVALRHNFSLKNVKVSAVSSTVNRNPTEVEGGGEVSNAIVAPTMEKVSISFGLSAPYQQFISFLQDLEASLRILDLDSLSLTSSDSGIYTWTVNLKTYWLRKP